MLCVQGLIWLDPALIADYDLAFDCCDLVTAEYGVIKMKSETASLAQFVADLQFSRLPQDVVERTRLLVLLRWAWRAWEYKRFPQCPHRNNPDNR